VRAFPSAEENLWTEDNGRYRRLEKTAYWGDS
jgi:hypothetical protein